MCGICGVKGLDPKEAAGMVERMKGGLVHRGPDEEGIYTDSDISMGVRRLNVIDLETGSQPMFNEDGSVAVVCNGEIYNFDQLREELAAKGHRFRTSSDTEVLAHAYEEYGVDCLDRLKGMFAFAAWDKTTKTLFLARDRFGIKPLFYWRDGETLIFSSELGPLIENARVEKRIDRRGLSLYFSFGYAPAPYSMIQEVRKLAPARYLLWRSGEEPLERSYWDLRDKGRRDRVSPEEARERLMELLRRSVRDHLISDVPLGVFLSGGIDSSTIAALALERTGSGLPTFSIGFEEGSYDESGYSSHAAGRLGTEHHRCVFTFDMFREYYPEVTARMDEPLADFSIFPTYALSRFARERVKVALSGEGGDEILMGYPTYMAHRYAHLYVSSSEWARAAMKKLIEKLPASFEYMSVDFRLKKFLKGISEKDPALRHMVWMGAFSGAERSLLFRPGIADNGGAAAGYLSRFIAPPKDIDPLKMIQYLDIRTYLAEDLLFKSDRASMFSSLEVRVPFLDHELAEFAWSLTADILYRKRLLRKAVKDIVPGSIIKRPKKGFPIPLSKWIVRKEFLDDISGYFDRDFVDGQGMFNAGYLERLLAEHLAGEKDNSKQIGAYIMFQRWHEKTGCPAA